MLNGAALGVTQAYHRNYTVIIVSWLDHRDLHVPVMDRMTLLSRGRFQRPAGVYLSIEDVDRGRGSRVQLGARRR